MIRSMTGFGRSSFRVGPASFDVEVRSVNHRYLDVRSRLPRAFGSIDVEVKERVSKVFARGKIEVNVVATEGEGPKPQLDIDLEAARAYVRAAVELAGGDDVAGPLDVGTLLALPGVASFTEPVFATDELVDMLGVAVDEALAATDRMRAAEGATLESELLARIANVDALGSEIECQAGTVVEAGRERLRKRSTQLQADTGLVDEARLYQEIVIAADRLDITEEIVRLRSHIGQFRSIIESGATGKPVGRRLDFLMQELGREVNTIGSKGSDASIAHNVVELKSELERIREQVQNIE